MDEGKHQLETSGSVWRRKWRMRKDEGSKMKERMMREKNGGGSEERKDEESEI